MKKVFDYTQDGFIRIMTGMVSLILRMWITSWVRTKARIQHRAANSHYLPAPVKDKATTIDINLSATCRESLQRPGMSSMVTNFIRHVIGTGLRSDVKNYARLPAMKSDGKLIDLTVHDLESIRHNVEARLHYRDTFAIGGDRDDYKLALKTQMLATVDSILIDYVTKLNIIMSFLTPLADTYRSGLLTSKWSNERAAYKQFGGSYGTPWFMHLSYSSGNMSNNQYTMNKMEYLDSRYFRDIGYSVFPLIFSIQICEATRQRLAQMFEKFLSPEMLALLLAGGLDSTMQRVANTNWETGRSIRTIFIDKGAFVRVNETSSHTGHYSCYVANGQVQTVLSFAPALNIINLAIVIKEEVGVVFLMPTYLKIIEDLAFHAIDLYEYTLVDPFISADTTGSLRELRYMPLTTYKDLVVSNDASLIPSISELVDFEQRIEEHDDIRTIRER